MEGLSKRLYSWKQYVSYRAKRNNLNQSDCFAASAPFNEKGAFERPYIAGTIGAFADIVLRGEELNKNLACKLKDLLVNCEDLSEILYFSNKIRLKYSGDEVKLCSIVNAKSGRCREDCSYCSQSSHNNSQIPIYPFIGPEAISKAYSKISKFDIGCFSVVDSGRSSEETEINGIAEFALPLAGSDITLSVSLGMLEDAELEKLKESGIKKIHCNLETSRAYFPKVCSTHTYDDKIQAIKRAQAKGFRICSGGIFGLGETWDDRIEMAFSLRELSVESVPMNFLNPIAGTKLENMKHLQPVEALKIIALYRFLLPKKDIFVCGGREFNLGDLQSMIFLAGANGMMVGDYLTTRGRNIEEDMKMIKDRV